MAVINASAGQILANLYQIIAEEAGGAIGKQIGLQFDKFTTVSMQMVHEAPTNRYYSSQKRVRTKFLFSFLSVNEKPFVALEELEKIKTHFMNKKYPISETSENEWWKIHGIRIQNEPNYTNIYEEGKGYVYQMAFSATITYHI
jgi:hypothetical protein